jgi:addiction module HigA family antidote
MGIKNGLPAVHPGVFLKEMLDGIGNSQSEFSRSIGVSAMRVSHIVKGTRPATAELALLFGKAFGSRRNTGSTSSLLTISKTPSVR